MNTLWSKALLAAVALAGVSCSSVAPVDVAVGDQCFRCRRVITEKRLAAEMIDANHLAYKFRGPECLAKYLADHPAETGTLFVTDFKTGHMITVDRATFVPIITDQNTMERGYRAYLGKADAEAAARELKTAAADWQGVVASAKS